MVITAILFAGPLLETSIPGEPDVAFAAFAPLPKVFGEKDRQRLAVAVRTLVDGSQEYTRRTIYNVTDGRTVDVALLPDGVVVRFTVPKENLSNGIALMDGLLRRPTVDETTLGRALVRIQRREPGYWAAALRPLRNDLKTLKAAEARALLQRVFQPQRTVVAVAGGFAEGQAEALWERRTADWKPTPEPRYPDITPRPEPTDNPSGVTTVELRGPAVGLGDASLPTRWLAMIALGAGKGSSLFRDVRQVEGWSYRQEAILWPDVGGLVPRIVAASAPDSGEAGRAEALRSALQKSVEGWTEKELKRAVSVAELTLEGGEPLGPLWLADGTVGSDLADRALLDAYWFAKSGRRWDAAGLLGQMRAVTLNDIKAAATSLLRDAKPIVLPGR